MVLQSTIVYTGPGNSPKLSVLHWADGTADSAIITQCETLLDAWAPWASNQYSARPGPLVRELNTATGVLVGEHLLTGGITTTTGTVSGQPVPDISQILVQWRTGVIVSGRRLRGRTFMPGFATDLVTGGNVPASAVTEIGAAAQSVATAGDALVVWSRRHGVTHDVTIGSCWTEFASQRRRRG